MAELSEGEELYYALGTACIRRLFETDAKCEPQADVLLRLEAIIIERDALRAKCEEQAKEIAERAAVLREARIFIHSRDCNWKDYPIDCLTENDPEPCTRCQALARIDSVLQQEAK